ncbi:hypothetical protein DNTS_005213, partial [Danionella cerebrum]
SCHFLSDPKLHTCQTISEPQVLPILVLYFRNECSYALQVQCNIFCGADLKLCGPSSLATMAVPGSGSAISLQVWMILMLVPRLQGKVLAPSHLHAIAGYPFMLACNISLETGEILKQVLWLDTTNKTILHYQPDEYRQANRADGVELSVQTSEALQAHNSVITVSKATYNSEGCYQCLFHVYPSGQQKGTICLTVTATEELMENKTAVSGKPVSFLCKYILSKSVQQVLWKKTTEQGDTLIVASHVRNEKPIVKIPFKGRVTLNASLSQTMMSIQQAETEDEGCYTCEFHTYPDGIKSTMACLFVYVLPKPEVSYVRLSRSVIEANCSTVSRPPAEISWNIEGHNKTLGPAVVSFYQQGDGTTMVVSSIQLQRELLDVQLVKCEVHHQGLESSVYVSLNKSKNGFVLLIFTSCVALVLLICLCICLKKC